jgi:hypothetical protein
MGSGRGSVPGNLELADRVVRGSKGEKGENHQKEKNDKAYGETVVSEEFSQGLHGLTYRCRIRGSRRG